MPHAAAAAPVVPGVSAADRAGAAKDGSATPPACEPTRGVGRPRDPKVDAAIVSATLQLVADGGFAAVTMEAVAALAGIGKATLYRRYAGKEQLVVDAIKSVSEAPQVMHGASVQEELVALLDTLRRRSDSTLTGKIFPQLISAASENPELMALYREQVLDPRRARFVSVLQRGVDQGLLRADVDLGYACDLIVGPVAYRNLIRTDPPPGPDFPAQVVRDVLVALAPTCTQDTCHGTPASGTTPFPEDR